MVKEHYAADGAWNTHQKQVGPVPGTADEKPSIRAGLTLISARTLSTRIRQLKAQGDYRKADSFQSREF